MSRDLSEETGVPRTSEPYQRAPDLHLLDDRYEVVGELRGSSTARYFFGRRRDDAREVLIAIADGDAVVENNALGHLASDARLLESRTHSTIARAIEGQWLGAGTYAIVTERVPGQTLHELLSADGAVPKPRIAFLLQDVNTALGWARGVGVVHRGVTPESMYIDPDSSRPRIVLSPTPIPLEGLPDAAADARTIGRLAWAMLAGRPYADDAPELSEIAPELAARVIDETTAMANLTNGEAVPDVERFLAIVAMGDALREAEIEMGRLQAELAEERRLELSRSEANARALEERAAAIESELARERASFEEMRRQEEAQLASARQQLVAERAQFDQERLEFSDRVAEFELRAAIERPAGPMPALPQLASEREEAELVGSGGRFGWLVPVGVVAMLVAMIAFGSVFARHRPPAQTVIFGRVRGVQPAELPQAVIPRGGFLTQSAGSVGSRITPRRVTDSAATRTRDSLARRDSIARDSVSRRDTLSRPDTAARLR